MGLRTFTFAGTSSSAYSMFITEAATYNVPERAVEMLDVPGRNGAYALDLGRFENVEVTYHVVVHKDTNANFQTELSDVRNWLASKVGYQRLTDDYNSNVYRMAIFKGGLETGETFVNGAEFDIVFECKPQRWLTSGETAVTVADGGTLDNPTPFEAEPLLAVDGYGTIGFNGYEVEINNATFGTVTLAPRKTNTVSNATNTIETAFDSNVVNANDTANINQLSLIYGSNYIYGSLYADIKYSRNLPQYTCSTATITDSNVVFSEVGYSSSYINYTMIASPFSFNIGTASTLSATSVASIPVKQNNVLAETVQISVSLDISYDGDSTVTATISTSMTGDTLGVFTLSSNMFRRNNIIAESTVTLLGNPTYIDCDIGECYMIKNNEIVSLNQYIDLGSDLPKLSSGTNTFALDNTVTQLEVTPRWWKV